MINGGLSSKFKHIKSLKDIKEISGKCIDIIKTGDQEKLIIRCPITFNEFNGNK